VRTLIDLPNPTIEALAALCERVKQPRTVIIRQAVAEYLERHASKPIEAGFGLWGADAVDGLAYQEQVRA
jgi:predicted transcriptional regulator